MSRIVRFLSSLAAVVGIALAMGLWVAPAEAAPSSPVQGEVRRVDPDGGRITLKHGPIPELELPAMTLVYRVQDKALIVPLKPGDSVVFTADRVDGQYVIISIRR
ncbi:MAG: copper-binding protein [Pigmentiphaga sp.]|nr:copper-binding protein [Pigmentiphaga sp.]